MAWALNDRSIGVGRSACGWTLMRRGSRSVGKLWAREGRHLACAIDRIQTSWGAGEGRPATAKCPGERRRRFWVEFKLAVGELIGLQDFTWFILCENKIDSFRSELIGRWAQSMRKAVISFQGRSIDFGGVDRPALVECRTPTHPTYAHIQRPTSGLNHEKPK